MDGKINNRLQVAYTRAYTLTEGKEDGLKVIEVNNGKIRFLLNVSKACDIMQLWHEGTNISFVSKNGFSAKDDSFLKRFEGGMLYTCGLDSIGNRDGYEMHGTLHNIPAKITECYIDEKEILIKADIENTQLFGANLLLRRTIKTGVNSNAVVVIDELINRGTKVEPYCILYHINLGYPFLNKDITINDQTREVVPRTVYAQDKIIRRTNFCDCIDNEQEVCYFIKHAKPEIEVVNEQLGKCFSLRYSIETLPCFVQWCSVSSFDYALGLEPSTTELDERFEYKFIQPNEKIRFAIEIRVE